jgi:hypothetical protein
MARKYQKNAVACMNAARLAQIKSQKARKQPQPVSSQATMASDITCPCPADPSDLGPECGYTGGFLLSDSDYDDSDFTDTSSEWSEAESLEEMTGEELEANLQELRGELETLQEMGATPYETIMHSKGASDWKKVEKNRQLGYNGQSRSTMYRNAKKARDGAALREASALT